MTQTKSAPWLVKSGGRILGPFSKEQIEQMLLSRALVVLDEVSLPTKRWTYIRDTQDFAKAIEEVRVRNLQGSDDTSTAPVGTVSITQSVTEPVSEYLDDRTDDISGFTNPQLKEIIYDSVRETPHQNNTKAQEKIATYGYAGDRVVRQKAQETSRFLWVITGGILLAVVGFVLFKQYVAQPIRQHIAKVDHLEMGKEAIQLGNYPKALEHLKKAFEFNSRQPEIYIFLAPLLLQVEGQTLQAKRLLTELIKSRPSEVDVRAATAMAIAHMMDFEWQRAEIQLSEAISHQENYSPAWVNWGLLALEKSEWSAARERLAKGIYYGERDGAAYLMLAEAFVQQWQTQNNAELLKEAKSYLVKFIEKNSDYKQEARFFVVYLDLLMGQNVEERQLTQILDMDPSHTDLHRKNLFIRRERAGWKALNPYCQQLYRKTQHIPRGRAWLAYCLLRGGNKDEAKTAIDDAVAQAPKDPLIQAVYAYILQELNLEGQASVALGRALEFDRKREYRLPLILQARFCHEQGELECASDMWRSVLQLDKNSLAAVVGLSDINFKQQNLAEGKKLLERAKSLSRDKSYRPLLELNATLLKGGLIAAEKSSE